jgi:hypothetical protein
MTEATPAPESDVPDAADREAVHEETGMTDPVADDDEGGSGTAGRPTDEKDQAGAYARDAEQDPDAERHDRADADTRT